MTWDDFFKNEAKIARLTEEMVEILGRVARRSLLKIHKDNGFKFRGINKIKVI